MGEFFQLISEHMSDIVQAVIGLFGVVIGWILNEISTKRREKTNLCFSLVGTPDDELVEKER